MAGTFAFEEAAVGIFVTVNEADGEFADEELSWWKRVSNRHPLFADLSANIFNPMIDRARQTLANVPWREAATRWARDVPPQYSELIFSMAVELAYVDDDISGKEPEVIIHLSRALGIPDDRAKQMIGEHVRSKIG